ATTSTMRKRTCKGCAPRWLLSAPFQRSTSYPGTALPAARKSSTRKRVITRRSRSSCATPLRRRMRVAPSAQHFRRTASTSPSKVRWSTSPELFDGRCSRERTDQRFQISLRRRRSLRCISLQGRGELRAMLRKGRELPVVDRRDVQVEGGLGRRKIVDVGNGI